MTQSEQKIWRGKKNIALETSGTITKDLTLVLSESWKKEEKESRVKKYLVEKNLKFHKLYELTDSRGCRNLK